MQKFYEMKASFAIYTLYIICCLTLFSCKKDSGIRFEQKVAEQKVNAKELKEVDKNSWMDEADMEFDVKVDVAFLQPTEERDSVVCAAINRYIVAQLLGQDVELGEDEAVARYIEDLKNEFSKDESPACYDHVKGVAAFGRKGIINYTLTEDFYGGGAHPTQAVIIKRFNANTGVQLGVWDVFVDSCSHSIKDILTNKLMEQQKVSSLDELRELGYLDMTDMFITDNFWLNQDSVVFFYNEYDIAPYACGQTRIAVAYDEIQHMMK